MKNKILLTLSIGVVFTALTLTGCSTTEVKKDTTPKTESSATTAEKCGSKCGGETKVKTSSNDKELGKCGSSKISGSKCGSDIKPQKKSEKCGSGKCGSDK